MEERTYRILLAIMAAIAAVALVVVAVRLTTSDESQAAWRSAGQIAGFLLLPIAIGGLWEWRTWGFWTLGAATAIGLVAYLPDGLFAGFWGTFLHFTAILMTVEQYLTRKQEAEEAASKPNEPSSDYTPHRR